MRCQSCLTQCFETDTWCPHCRRMLVGEVVAGQRSAMWVFGVVFAAIGATAVAMTPVATDHNPSRLTIAGVGAMIGWILGMAVGLLLDRIVQKSKAVAVQVDARSARPAIRS